MLMLDADFPNNGAQALLIQHHRKQLVRITQQLGGRGRNRMFLVSIIGREGSTAVTRAPLSELAPATPLNAKEEAEYDRLEAKLAGKDKADRRDLARFEHLRLRWAHAEEIAELERPRRRPWPPADPAAERRARA